MTTHTDGRACRVLRHTLLPPRGPHKQYDSRNLRGQTDRTGFVDTGKTAAVCVWQRGLRWFSGRLRVGKQILTLRYGEAMSKCNRLCGLPRQWRHDNVWDKVSALSPSSVRVYTSHVLCIRCNLTCRLRRDQTEIFTLSDGGKNIDRSSFFSEK